MIGVRQLRRCDSTDPDQDNNGSTTLRANRRRRLGRLSGSDELEGIPIVKVTGVRGLAVCRIASVRNATSVQYVYVVPGQRAPRERNKSGRKNSRTQRRTGELRLLKHIGKSRRLRPKGSPVEIVIAAENNPRRI